MVRQWLEASKGMLKIAFVVPADFIDPEKFGIIAPANYLLWLVSGTRMCHGRKNAKTGNND